MPKVPKTSLQNLCTSIKENVKDELDLLAKDKCQRFLLIAIIILDVCVCVARHAQIIQNNKFAISLQYLKNELSDEVDFLLAD